MRCNKKKGDTHNERDILRLYEVWLKTGSPRAREILRRLGVDPISTTSLSSQ